MPDNLSASIGINTGKFVADAAIIKKQITDLKKELTDLTKAGAEQKAQATGTQIAELTRQYNELTRVIRAHTQATHESTRAHHAETMSVREATFEMGHFLHAAGLGIEGLKALKFGFAGLITAEVIRGFNEAVKSINELNNAAKAVGGAGGGDPAGLRAMRLAAREAGQEMSIADEISKNFNKTLDAAAMKQLQGRGGASGVNVLAGNIDNVTGSLQDFQSVVRGGVAPKIGDLSDPRYILGRDINIKNREAESKALAKAILEIKDANLQNAAAVAQTRRNYSEIEPTLRRFVGGTLPKVEPETEKQKQDLKEYNELVGQGKQRWEDITEAIARSGIAITVATSKAQTYIDLIKTARAGMLGEVPLDISKLPSPATPQPAPAAPATSEEGGASAPLPPKAGGGYISGPGSGTSDSIMARLSNGEFVVNARAVGRLGVGFLDRLNRYADGGAVDDGYGPSISTKYQSERYQAALARDRPRRGGRQVSVRSPVSGGTGRQTETDEEYYRRTGFHYGARAGERPLRQDIREVPLRQDIREYPLFAGGLVGAPQIHFADGGLVGSSSSSGGTPVHLHLGSQVFSTTASESVASALVTEAHRQAMTSTGVKPSWFASRPGGH